MSISSVKAELMAQASNYGTCENYYYLRDSKNITEDETTFYSEPGTILFNQSLIPLATNAVMPIGNPYRPNVQSEFYRQLEVAQSQGVTFALCLVDIFSGQVKPILKLIAFCQKQSIPIVLFEYSQMFSLHSRVPVRIKDALQMGTMKYDHIIKETFSIFSSPKFHKRLNELKTDALIIAGAAAECCIEASAIGTNEDFEYSAWHGKEHGAVDYGYSVYT
ncbi:MAG: cysteine hydrolase, partial [Shewanella sp.]|nr:cysteine hydrolase [Shewanella sp.]